MLLNTLSIEKVQCHIFFPSQDIKQNGLSSYLDNCWRDLRSSFTLMPDKNGGGGEEENTEIQKFEYLENEKSFFIII